jgi:hypothetical protein
MAGEFKIEIDHTQGEVIVKNNRLLYDFLDNLPSVFSLEIFSECVDLGCPLFQVLLTLSLGIFECLQHGYELIHAASIKASATCGVEVSASLSSLP